MLNEIDFDRNVISAIIMLRKSKTDQEVIGETLFSSPKTQRLVKCWREAAKISERVLFRGVKIGDVIVLNLSAGQENTIDKCLTVNANIPTIKVKQISGTLFGLEPPKALSTLTQVVRN